MIIVMIWDADYPWDVRVEKVSKSLIKAGYSVHLVCRNVGQKSSYELLDGLHIHRLPPFRLVGKSLNRFLSFPAFFSPLWLWKIWRVASKVGADAILVRDLPMCPAGILVARKLRIPCLMDMAECYPEMLRCTWRFEGFKLKNLFLRNPVLADIVEQFCISRLAKIFVMIEESRARLIRMGVEPDKIVQVSNTPPVGKSGEYLQSKLHSDGATLVYVGLINPSRGLDTVIEGARILRDRGCSFRLRVAGLGKQFSYLQSLVKKYGLESHVELLGWVDHKKLSEVFSSASIGLVPHHVCSHWDNTIPNKLFDYMAAGIPVISTNVIPMQRIIDEVGSGAVFVDWDAKGFADLVEDLLRSPSRLKEMGSNGVRAIHQRFNWEVDERNMLDAMCSLSVEK